MVGLLAFHSSSYLAKGDGLVGDLEGLTDFLDGEILGGDNSVFSVCVMFTLRRWYFFF